MKDEKQTAAKGQLTTDFERLMDTYRQMFEMAASALAPEATARRRNEVLQALNEFLKSPTK